MGGLAGHIHAVCGGPILQSRDGPIGLGIREEGGVRAMPPVSLSSKIWSWNSFSPGSSPMIKDSTLGGGLECSTS